MKLTPTRATALAARAPRRYSSELRRRTRTSVRELRSAYESDWNDRLAALRPRLERVALRVLGNAQDAEDAVQEALLRVWMGAHTVRDSQAFLGWALSVQRNVALTAARRRGVRKMAPLDDRDEIDRRQPQPEAIPVLNELVASLPPGERRALQDLVDGHGLRAIAVREGASYGATKTRICRARAKLRRALCG